VGFAWQGCAEGVGGQLIENKIEIESRQVLELQAPLAPVRLAPDDDIRGHEAEKVEVVSNLCGIPNLTVSSFETFPLGHYVVRFDGAVDFRQPAAEEVFHIVLYGCHNVRYECSATLEAFLAHARHSTSVQRQGLLERLRVHTTVIVR